jgi:hypothetical protein
MHYKKKSKRFKKEKGSKTNPQPELIFPPQNPNLQVHLRIPIPVN